jgi:hypothetical protein
LLGVGYIHRYCKRFSAGGGNFCGHYGKLLRIARGHGYTGSRMRQRESGGAADSL